jgi:hypothetical protein
MPAGLNCTPIPGQPHRYRIVNRAEEHASLTVLPDLHYDISATGLRSHLSGGEPEPGTKSADTRSADTRSADTESADTESAGAESGGPAFSDPHIDPAVLAYIRRHGLYRG